jgi:hypothetical protein
MWLQAEKAGLLPGRTWQSMRERYSKYVRRLCVLHAPRHGP